ncbi:MAG: hypothetical protein EZS28_033054 [Streblomastix strix]|uniref:Uncharacterized protein n=1 Tax=Streblomastix strix TaxID=222440 RepID=A0A5J4ULP0_9EUKA|nr:MAG: hypothetical protein EZS28_033054 [Streblomastix strix]
MYGEVKKALLILAFKPRHEIEAFLADQGFAPLIFDKDDPCFIEKLDTLKLYVLSKQMAYEDLTQKFPAMINIYLKTDMQQKMTYAQVAKSQEEELRFYMGRSPKAQLIANSKMERPAALLPGPSAPPQSTVSTLVAQGPADITRHIQEGANTGDTLYQPRVRVDQVALDHHEEIGTITDIITINIAIDMANFGRQWPQY